MNMLMSDNLCVPGIVHGFFGRNGGFSSGIYSSLNVGFGSGDDIETVAKNRAVVTDTLGQSPEALCTAYQIHSPTAVVLEKPWIQKDAPQADALVTRTPGIALGILTADCLPILFADAKHRVIGAAHAGWKGAIGGVIESTIATMQSLGANTSSMTAAIGPAIAQASYEVGSEFYNTFLKHSADNTAYFIPSSREGHHLFDLKTYAYDRLRKAGISQINVLAQDTCLQENDFFSYRRSCLRGETVYGRQVSVIALEK